jgi:beta-lactamase class D
MEAYSQPVPLRRPEMVQPAFKAILDSLDIVGSILVFDSGKNEYWSNDFNRARDGFIPASTFKIPNSLIAIETGYLEGESHVFKWDGQKRALPNWEQDLTLRQAFQLSCVPCYQQVAREIGPESMRRYLDSFNYGNIVFDSTQIDSFWLRGASNRCCSFSSSLNGKLI